MFDVRRRVLVLFCPIVLASVLSGTETAPPDTFAAIARAIRANDLRRLQSLVATPEAANICDRLKATPLHYAAIYGSPQSVRILLKAGAHPKARNQSGATPLHYAAWNFEKTRLLVESGADVNAAESGGVTPLMVAASAHGNISTVGYLIEKGANVRAVDALGRDALTRASFQSNPIVLQTLLAFGANARNADRAGFTVLNGLTGIPEPERVEALLAAGADPNAANVFAGQVRKGSIALIHLTPLMLAAPYGDSQAISGLLRAGARVNETDSRKVSPLMLSIASDQAKPETVRQLIAAGADVNAKDQNGETALTWARKFRNPEILTLLTAAGGQGPELTPEPHRPARSQPANARAAVERSVRLLAKSGPQFFREGGCAGCHHQPIHAQAFAAANRAGLKADAAIQKTFFDSITASRPIVSPMLPLLRGPGGDYDPLLAALMAFADLGEPANDSSDLMIHYIAVRQHPSGGWIDRSIARPPIEDSSISRTSMAIRALKHYGWPARQAEFAERIERARTWLENAEPVTTYERADKLTGLCEAGAPLWEVRAEAEALLRLQRADGGWAQTRFLDSDAYATGLVLHALYAAGLSNPQDKAYQRGVRFLLRTQFPDGSWYVRSRVAKFQPYFESGFPFGHDQWISSTATSYAVMALAPAAAVQ